MRSSIRYSVLTMLAVLWGTPAQASPPAGADGTRPVWPAGVASEDAPGPATMPRVRYCTTASCRGREPAPAAHLAGFGGAVAAGLWLRRRLNVRPD